MIQKQIYYSIIFFCSLNTLTIFSQPEKESMEHKPIHNKTSGKVLALTCAVTGCCLGKTAQVLGYDTGPYEGWIAGSLCSLTLPVVFRSVKYCKSYYKKQS